MLKIFTIIFYQKYNVFKLIQKTNLKTLRKIFTLKFSWHDKNTKESIKSLTRLRFRLNLNADTDPRVVRTVAIHGVPDTDYST